MRRRKIMAVQKTISYVDKNNVVRTTTITIDIEKIAFGYEVDEEEVYLVVNAPGIPSGNIWRRNIDKMVEDGLFASGVYNDGPPADHSTNFVHPQDPDDINTEYGTRFTVDEENAEILSHDVSGVVTQLRAL